MPSVKFSMSDLKAQGDGQLGARCKSLGKEHHQGSGSCLSPVVLSYLVDSFRNARLFIILFAIFGEFVYNFG